MTSTLPPCWICGHPATTGEHKAKRSDLRDVFLPVTQQKPLYYRDDKIGRRAIGSFDAKPLKFPNKICEHCNSARTQPHDRAWEVLSAELRRCISKLTPGAYVRTNRIFRKDTARHMLSVHLFFIKQFGALILEGKAPIDVAPFAAAIMNNKAHLGVYLQIGCGPTLPSSSLVERSDLHIDTRTDGSCAHARWIYNVDGLCIQVTYAENGMQHGFGWWHPSLGTNRLLIGDMSV